jgi:hypothetical protein
LLSSTNSFFRQSQESVNEIVVISTLGIFVSLEQIYKSLIGAAAIAAAVRIVMAIPDADYRPGTITL